jgi:hypothetical protein
VQVRRPGLTTEHFTPQTARAGTIADSNGRAALYLSTVSGAVVALGAVKIVAALVPMPPIHSPQVPSSDISPYVDGSNA